MEQIYAAALWKAVEGGTNPKEAVTALREALEKRGRAALFPRIARAFRRHAERELAKDTVVLSLRNVRDEHARKEALATLSASGISKTDVEVKEDDSLIGGWRLEGKGILADSSFKKHLLSIYNRATQS